MYAQRGEVLRAAVDGGDPETIVRTGTPDVYGSSGPRVAYVTGAVGRVDFVDRPVLHVLDTDTAESRRIGPGVAPLWDSAGEKLAFLRPTGQRRCEGEACFGLATVHTFEASSGRSTRVLPPGRWGLLSWLGDRILVSYLDSPDEVVVAGGNGVSTLDLRPSELWGGSPDGRWLLVSGQEGASFVEVDGLSLGEGHPVELPGVLGLGAWAPDSSGVAAVVLGPRSSELYLLSPGERPVAVEGSRGALGGTAWAPDADALAYTVARDEAVSARYCSRPPGQCATVISWKAGITLLGVN